MTLTVAQLLQRLEASGVLTDADFAAVREAAGQDTAADAEPFLKRLHKEGRLTAYQAQILWKGKGQQLAFGNYVVEDDLGRGGMGVVLKARHKRMQRQVAIKVLPTAMVKDAAAIARFQREVVAAAKLTHTNIVGAFDADDINGQHILVMEFVDGRDLSSIVKKQGPLPIQQAVDCVIQAARGLEFAHRQGVIHRDIKPANLLLDSSGTVKILDMGLARLSGASDVGNQAELTGTGVVMGTVDYMSPEQAINTKMADARSDIYSLGITLYYLLTGKPAFDGDSLMSRLMAHANAPIPKLQTLRAETPPNLQAVFEKMVAKKPEDRYPSMTDVLADLETCRSDATGTALRVSAPSTGSSSEGLSSFLHRLDGEGSSASLGARAASKTVRRPRTSPEEPTIATQSDVGTQPNMRPAVRKKGARDKSSARSAPWTDWRWLAAGAGVLGGLLALLMVALRSKAPDASSPEPVPQSAVSPVAVAAIVPPAQSLPTSLPKIDSPVAVSVDPHAPLTGPQLAAILDSEETVWGAPQNLGPGINTNAGEELAGMSEDELTLYFGRGTNLYVSERASLLVPFPTGRLVPMGVPAGDHIRCSTNGLTCFAEQRFERGRREVWFADRADRQSAFSDGAVAPEPVNDNMAAHPVLSPDGLTLLIASTRPGSTSSDVWMFTRSALDQPFANQSRLPEPVNSPEWDMPAFITNDRLLVIVMRQGKDSNGEYRKVSYFVRGSADEPFGPGKPLGIPLGTAADSTGNAAFYLSPDGQRAYFQSMHYPGGFGYVDIWVSQRVPNPSVATVTSPPHPGPGASAPAPGTATIAELLTSDEYEWTPPENLGSGVNGTFFEEAPSLTGDGLTLWFMCGGELFSSTRADVTQPFPGRRQEKQVNDPAWWDNSPYISADGLALIFQSTRGSEPGKDNADLFVAVRRSTSEPFDRPVRLPTAVNSDQAENGPCLSSDGLTLLFNSGRPPGSGGLDLWQATRRSRDAEFDTAENLGPIINSDLWDIEPQLSSDGTALLFASNRHSRTSDYDLYVSTRPNPSVPFGRPVSLGSMVNSRDSESAPCLSSDGRTLLFQSDRPGGLGKTDLWMSRRVPKGQAAK